jgi:hypothetical protein
MADPVEKKTDDDALDVSDMSGISNAGPPIDPPDPKPVVPAANGSSATAQPQSKPGPKDTKSTQTPDAPDDAQQQVGAPNEVVDTLSKMLSLKGLDPHMAEMLRAARLRPAKDNQGVLIDLPHNGHCLHCSKLKDGTEFIGMPHKKMLVDEHDAHIMIGLAKARGWKAVNVSGTEKERENIWLEAMRQGLAVANWRPDPNSAVAQKWAQELSEQPVPNVTEAKPVDHHLNTMKLFKLASEHATDNDVKAGLESTLKKFQEGTFTGTEAMFRAAGEALGDKANRENYNKMVDALNKVEPKLALTKLEAAAPQAQPAAKVDAPATP